MSNTQETKSRKSNAGRKWFDGKDEKVVLPKLEQVFAIDGSIEEACFYAEISKSSFYRYWEANPKFRDKVEALREKPILKARQTVVASLDDSNNAFRYLERKRRKEFGPGVDITSEGEKIEGVSVTIVHETESQSDNPVRKDVPEQKEDNSAPGGDGVKQDV